LSKRAYESPNHCLVPIGPLPGSMNEAYAVQTYASGQLTLLGSRTVLN